METKTDLRSLTIEEIKNEISAMGEKPFRAKQIFDWLHIAQVSDTAEMTNIPKTLREELDRRYRISDIKIAERYVSEKDNTIKYLFELENNIIIESVLMRYSYGNAVCISSQAGCRMGCKFCASTVDGLERNLTAGEMALQIYKIQRDIGERISNVVIMGSGEPLDNYDNLLRFLKIIGDGIGIGQRHITVSTCGLVDKMKELAKSELQITLAVSLHAPNDEIRKKTMPIANRYGIDELISAAREYANKTKRRVTFEYALIKGVNDSRKNAEELAKRLKGGLFHVNLIPVNDVKENNFLRSDEQTIKDFAAVLSARGINTTVRRRLGSDINAACGQLRKRYKDNLPLISAENEPTEE